MVEALEGVQSDKEDGIELIAETYLRSLKVYFPSSADIRRF